MFATYWIFHIDLLFYFKLNLIYSLLWIHMYDHLKMTTKTNGYLLAFNCRNYRHVPYCWERYAACSTDRSMVVTRRKITQLILTDQNLVYIMISYYNNFSIIKNLIINNDSHVNNPWLTKKKKIELEQRKSLIAYYAQGR